MRNALISLHIWAPGLWLVKLSGWGFLEVWPQVCHSAQWLRVCSLAPRPVHSLSFMFTVGDVIGSASCFGHLLPRLLCYHRLPLHVLPTLPTQLWNLPLELSSESHSWSWNSLPKQKVAIMWWEPKQAGLREKVTLATENLMHPEKSLSGRPGEQMPIKVHGALTISL